MSLCVTPIRRCHCILYSSIPIKGFYFKYFCFCVKVTGLAQAIHGTVQLSTPFGTWQPFMTAMKREATPTGEVAFEAAAVVSSDHTHTVWSQHIDNSQQFYFQATWCTAGDNLYTTTCFCHHPNKRNSGLAWCSHDLTGRGVLLTTITVHLTVFSSVPFHQLPHNSNGTWNMPQTKNAPVSSSSSFPWITKKITNSLMKRVHFIVFYFICMELTLKYNDTVLCSLKKIDTHTHIYICNIWTSALSSSFFQIRSHHVPIN